MYELSVEEQVDLNNEDEEFFGEQNTDSVAGDSRSSCSLVSPLVWSTSDKRFVSGRLGNIRHKRRCLAPACVLIRLLRYYFL